MEHYFLQFIGFTMYTTCVIWLAFFCIYFGSDAKVLTMTLCISFSATVALCVRNQSTLNYSTTYTTEVSRWVTVRMFVVAAVFP